MNENHITFKQQFKKLQNFAYQTGVNYWDCPMHTSMPSEWLTVRRDQVE
jgi:hypothetical protein